MLRMASCQPAGIYRFAAKKSQQLDTFDSQNTLGDFDRVVENA
jgi:hypothetical protein